LKSRGTVHVHVTISLSACACPSKFKFNMCKCVTCMDRRHVARIRLPPAGVADVAVGGFFTYLFACLLLPPCLAAKPPGFFPLFVPLPASQARGWMDGWTDGWMPACLDRRADILFKTQRAADRRRLGARPKGSKGGDHRPLALARALAAPLAVPLMAPGRRKGPRQQPLYVTSGPGTSHGPPPTPHKEKGDEVEERLHHEANDDNSAAPFEPAAARASE
jgi:hypothetical protein